MSDTEHVVPVLVIRGECDRLVPPQVAPETAAAQPVTMGHIDAWMAGNHVLAAD